MSKRPKRRPDDPQLADLYDAAQDAATAQVGADRAPGLITAVPTFAELRRTPGDVANQAGPAAITVAGIRTPGDNGAPMQFVWMPGSTQQDNNGDNSAGPGVIAVVGIDRGRWTRSAAAPSVQSVTAGTGGVTITGTPTDPVVNIPAPVPIPGLTLLRRSVLTSGTSLAKAPGCTYAKWRQWGGGGGGGGVIAGNGSTNATVAGGGAAGGKAEGETTTIPASWAYVIGAGGAAGTTAGGDGGTGGDTTFSDGTTIVTAKGGPGGKGWSTTASTTANAKAGGAPPAVSTNGVMNGSGAPGSPGLILSPPNFVVSGAGGSTEWGGGGPSVAPPTFGGAGVAAIGFGSGGSGACTSISAIAAALGGAGKSGVIELEEWG